MSKTNGSRRENTGCYCEDGPTFDKDFVFEDGSGFECTACAANVYYEVTA